MSDVVSWVAEFSIKPGQLDSFKSLVGELVQSNREEADVLAYEFFLSEDNSSCHIYERYADSAAVVAHLGAFHEKFAERFMSAVSLTRFTVYGPASDEIKGVLGGVGANFMDQFNGFARGDDAG